MLFVEAILILVFGFIGSIVLSNQKTIAYKEAEYSWEEAGYETVEKFNPEIFISGLFSTIIFASALYAGSVCYDKIINNDILSVTSKDTVE